MRVVLLTRAWCRALEPERNGYKKNRSVSWLHSSATFSARFSWVFSQGKPWAEWREDKAHLGFILGPVSV
jgi:hypothetical protein